MKKSVFQTAVDGSPDISCGFNDGLKALSDVDARKVSVRDTWKIDGSVNIDMCTKKLYPESARWNYVIGYDNKAYFMEVHPAIPKTVSEIINKKCWLDGWLKTRAVKLGELQSGKTVYWVPSGKNAILKTSKEYRQIAKHNVELVKKLVLK